MCSYKYASDMPQDVVTVNDTTGEITFGSNYPVTLKCTGESIGFLVTQSYSSAASITVEGTTYDLLTIDSLLIPATKKTSDIIINGNLATIRLTNMVKLGQETTPIDEAVEALSDKIYEMQTTNETAIFYAQLPAKSSSGWVYDTATDSEQPMMYYDVSVPGLSPEGQLIVDHYKESNTTYSTWKKEDDIYLKVFCSGFMSCEEKDKLRVYVCYDGSNDPFADYIDIEIPIVITQINSSSNLLNATSMENANNKEY